MGPHQSSQRPGRVELLKELVLRMESAMSQKHALLDEKGSCIYSLSGNLRSFVAKQSRLQGSRSDGLLEVVNLVSICWFMCRGLHAAAAEADEDAVPRLPRFQVCYGGNQMEPRKRHLEIALGEDDIDGAGCHGETTTSWPSQASPSSAALLPLPHLLPISSLRLSPPVTEQEQKQENLDRNDDPEAKHD
ncbi:unnamed protein product [Triticum turgidum subsp. durum]|uniref:Uncharacterized protein n=1 Tax=Triticum turgidum subsp. durum TaxID=4567 RepID=A0A9R1REY1_TRITD|nr:unnamed protein product [Triticum turgidum subsp. durum]